MFQDLFTWPYEIFPSIIRDSRHGLTDILVPCSVLFSYASHRIERHYSLVDFVAAFSKHFQIENALN